MEVNKADKIYKVKKYLIGIIIFLGIFGYFVGLTGGQPLYLSIEKITTVIFQISAIAFVIGAFIVANGNPEFRKRHVKIEFRGLGYYFISSGIIFLISGGLISFSKIAYGLGFDTIWWAIIGFSVGVFTASLLQLFLIAEGIKDSF